jgi:hypothetical protein
MLKAIGTSQIHLNKDGGMLSTQPTVLQSLESGSHGTSLFSQE